MSREVSRRRRRGAQASAGPRRGAPPTQARIVAVRVLERVERAGAYADLALSGALRRSGLSPRDRAFVTELVYGTLRWRGHLDALLRAVLDRPNERLEALVTTLLRVGAYQIVFEHSVPSSAAVDQTVRCARALGVSRAAGLVNAVLRRLARGHETIPMPSLEDDACGHLVDALSLPSPIAERWLARLGPEEAALLAEASNKVPPLVARLNPQRTDRETLLDELRSRLPDVKACRYAPLGVNLGHHGYPGHDPAFLEGRFTIQDEGSQLVVELLDPRPGERVLDVCAAPGGKAGAIAERVGEQGRVDAYDRNPRRLGLVARSARRLGLGNVQTREVDATRPLPDEGTLFDRVLVDAPCSGLGTLRRNPDARWRFDEANVGRLVEIQQQILRRSAAALRPGGTLVYSTCTLLPEENEAVVEGFLTEAKDFTPCKPEALPEVVQPLIGDAGWLSTWPHRHDTDGFFAARLERKA
ncbi:MAG: 16S rRNA (cytosine(967)-C(5))-methyltransferase RsmB [bacterium]|nr:16S rRNA (cytosine(967)-C(5))-methyltransferase RsmB [bacterium]